LPHAWYLHLCAAAGVVVTDYADDAHSEMEERRDGGHFTSVVLRPRVTVASADQLAIATGLHQAAHRACFIASSVNFPVRCEPTTTSS
jgi:organic hydroperoxide reductase OsmC/OhrA